MQEMFVDEIDWIFALMNHRKSFVIKVQCRIKGFHREK
jgi:hypothetical protein